MQDPANELRRTSLPRTSVNKGKKKGRGCLKPRPLLTNLLVLSWRRFARGVLVLYRQGLTLTLALRFLPAWVLANRRNLGERHSAKRHRQRHHHRRDQQRNALAHLGSFLPIPLLLRILRLSRRIDPFAASFRLPSSPPVPRSERKTGSPSPPAAKGVAGCATGSSRLPQAPILRRRASKPLHLFGFVVPCALLYHLGPISKRAGWPRRWRSWCARMRA
jgi:hypothetical protein